MLYELTAIQTHSHFITVFKPKNMLNHYQHLASSKTLNPNLLSLFNFPSINPSEPKFHKTIFVSLKPHQKPSPISLQIHSPPRFHSLRCFAGRSKGKSSVGRFDGNAELLRRIKQNARRKAKKYAESFFYRLKNPNKNYPDNFTEDELQLMGLGYDRMVRFMEKDDPNLRHPYDWYKYGEYGPYSWRGVVLGDPVRGQFSDERVTMMSEVKNHEEWEKIEQHEMNIDCNEQVSKMDKSVGLRYFWVFVRHPKWRLNELPWQQWTLVAEVTLEAGKQRLDKWSLMGRLGNNARKSITQCAAWMRPDIVYVKRPVYQLRFEPQDDFFRLLTPFLDPKTEQDFLFPVRNEDGTEDACTYFGGLCKIVKVNPKAFVDDVVNAYEKLSDERKSDCLRFLLENHPVPLLHPYTKEWKVKLEEQELGCDAPDDDEERHDNAGENFITEWIETDEDDDDDDDDDGGDDVIMDMEDGGEDNEDDDSRNEEEDLDEEENEEYWEKEFQKGLSSADEMEKLAARSSEITTELYKRQLKTLMQHNKKMENIDKITSDDGDETALRAKEQKSVAKNGKLLGLVHGERG